VGEYLSQSADDRAQDRDFLPIDPPVELTEPRPTKVERQQCDSTEKSSSQIAHARGGRWRMERAHPIVRLHGERHDRTACTMKNAPVTSEHSFRLARRARCVENAGGRARLWHRAHELRVLRGLEAVDVELRYRDI